MAEIGQPRKRQARTLQCGKPRNDSRFVPSTRPIFLQSSSVVLCLKPSTVAVRWENPTSAAGFGFWMDGLFLAAFLAHLPLGVEYSRRMWSVGHYQFFPLLMAAAGWLIYDRLTTVGQQVPRTYTVLGLLGLSWVLLAAAVVMFSPFFWIASLLFLLAVYVFDRWGWPGLRVSAPAWLLMLFAVPWPANLDLKLINQMQFLSSQLASWILDAFGQNHFRQGVVLVTEKKQFFTEEACSGIRSLFSSLAAIAIYGVMNRYPLWRHIFNLVQTVAWVIVGNAIRVAAVVYLADNVNENFATGTTHEMLGLVAFIFIFLCAMSTDRGINAWQAARPNFMDDALTDFEADESEPSSGNRHRQPVACARGGGGLQWVLVGLFVLIALFGARLTYAKIAEDNLDYYDAENDLIVSSESDLPAEINGWVRQGFSHQMRDDTRLLAPESYLWTYVKSGRRVTISIDSPYYDFHNLNDCYEGFGWHVEHQHRYPEGQSDLNQPVNLTELTMTKSGEYGLVLFTAFDRTGQLVRPTFDSNYDPTRWMEMQRNVSLALGTLDQTSDPRTTKQPLPITQVQLLHTSSREIEDVADLKQLFQIVRGLMLQTERFQNPSR